MKNILISYCKQIKIAGCSVVHMYDITIDRQGVVYNDLDEKIGLLSEQETMELVKLCNIVKCEFHEVNIHLKLLPYIFVREAYASLTIYDQPITTIYCASYPITSASYKTLLKQLNKIIGIFYLS